MQLRLRPPKGPGELAIAPLGPLGTPLPFLTRSRGCVLRKIRFCQASFWWSEGDGVVPTERTRLVEIKCLGQGLGEAPKGACGRQAGLRREVTPGAAFADLVRRPRILHKRKIRELQSMVPEFVLESAGAGGAGHSPSAMPTINPQETLADSKTLAA